MNLLGDLRKKYNRFAYHFNLDNPKDGLELLEYVNITFNHTYNLTHKLKLPCKSVGDFMSFVNRVEKVDNKKIDRIVEDMKERTLSEWLISKDGFIYEETSENKYELLDFISNLIEYTGYIESTKDSDYKNTRAFLLKKITFSMLEFVQTVDFRIVNGDKENLKLLYEADNDKKIEYVKELRITKANKS